ncbi:hypothetical protein FAQ01_20650 [Flavobacterium aquatile]|nr:hypothetical protein FAQ01_20650 [Flavobacterium aquatile]
MDVFESVEIGNYEAWSKHSDHKPLLFKFSIYVSLKLYSYVKSALNNNSEKFIY